MTLFEEQTIRNVLEALEKRGYLAGSLTADLLFDHLWGTPEGDEEAALLREIQLQLAKGVS